MTIVRIDEGARMSQAVVHGGTVYLAGQVGTPSDSVEAQTKQVLASIDDLLVRAGSGRDRLLRATVVLADMADYDAMNRCGTSGYKMSGSLFGPLIVSDPRSRDTQSRISSPRPAEARTPACDDIRSTNT